MNAKLFLAATVTVAALALTACARGENPAVAPPPTGATTSPTPAATAATGPLTIQMQALNNSGESGTATLTPQGSKTMVEVKLSNPPATQQPAHIHPGTCVNLGAPKYALSHVVAGTSTTTVDVSLDDLLAQPFAINVHKSAAEAQIYFSCGDIKR
jgi:Cu/Zn superoxide dismutase